VFHKHRSGDDDNSLTPHCPEDMKPRWTLTAKIALFSGLFLLLSLLSVCATLWISWNLEGGAAAVNVAGQLRMLSYKAALTSASRDTAQLASDLSHMQDNLDMLRTGSPSRPLYVPWNRSIRARFDLVQRHWQSLRPQWQRAAAGHVVSRQEVDQFVAQIDAFVSAIEHRLDFWTTVLHGFQMGLAALVVIGTLLMFYAGYLFVLDPVGRLSRGVQSLERGDYSVRVQIDTSDELGDLAVGFNRMAGQLQTVHADLEARVQQKTAALQAEQLRLAALYRISALVSKAQSLDELAKGFVGAIQDIAGADAALLRWTDETARRYLLLAAQSMPQTITEAERCLLAGACHCGQASAGAGPQVVQFRPATDNLSSAPDDACVREGFATLVSVPVSVQQRLLGEIDLFYRREHRIDPEQSALLDALAGHLAAAMESLRSVALEREAAVARERALLARELHDSIAQALAFMKMQLQILRSAMKSNNAKRIETSVDELDAGVRESLADVRELLLHFRTRTQDQDIEPALRSTLQKFELQSGVPVQLQFSGHGQPLDPDVQIQVLHVLQEALSNVRKHAHASRVEVEVTSLPRWRFAVRDDGQGYDPNALQAAAQGHVGLQIMRERAAQIGGTLQIHTAPARGTQVILELPDAFDHSGAVPSDATDPTATLNHAP
jgi:two-component system nitrate/nitrite sensor histidine kinase NarX